MDLHAPVSLNSQGYYPPPEPPQGPVIGSSKSAHRARGQSAQQKASAKQAARRLADAKSAAGVPNLEEMRRTMQKNRSTLLREIERLNEVNQSLQQENSRLKGIHGLSSGSLLETASILAIAAPSSEVVMVIASAAPSLCHQPTSTPSEARQKRPHVKSHKATSLWRLT